MEVLDVSDPAFHADPYPALRRVREAGPSCRVEPFGFVGVTRYRDVAAVLKNPRVFASRGLEREFPPIPGAELFARASVLLGADPPQHTRVRRLVQRAFTLQEMAAWEPKIEALVRDMVAGLAARPGFDLIAELAMPLPVIVISEMLGVDAARRLDFKRWSDDMVSVRAVQVCRDPVRRARREAEIVQSAAEFKAYFEGVIEARRRDPSGPDLISAMVRASEGEQILRPDEVLGLTRLMLVAGNETTTNLLGNAMSVLLSRPELWRRLVADPVLAEAVTEEALRFDGPVVQLVRRATEDTEIAGTRIAAETVVAPLVASANRDPERFPDPDRFDPERANVREHLAFGSGIHLCVGAPLARMEARIALRHLASSFADLALATTAAERNESFFLRGYKSLHLARGGRPTVGAPRHEPAVEAQA